MTVIALKNSRIDFLKTDIEKGWKLKIPDFFKPTLSILYHKKY